MRDVNVGYWDGPAWSCPAMMLVDDGKLSLDDPVEKYIGAFANAKAGVDISDEAGQYPLKLEPLKRPITSLDLLRHTSSGITYDFFGEGQALCGSCAVRRRFRQRRIRRPDRDTLPLADQPGVRWDYGHSTDILGRVVELVSGKTLFQFEKERLFDPLGMSETAYYVADDAKWSRIAQPFPVDRFRVAGIKDPTLPRRWESGGRVSSRRSATTPASCRCC
jgi:CubicO group peptidase (beta-lactamase class C family)